MPALNILIGGESFREIRERNCFYVDKTDLLEELLASVPPKVSLFTRPRRFGKTLTMSMLREFFDIQKDSKGIFEGLKVARNKALCDEWMNKFPVVFLSLKYVEGQNFDHAVAQFASLISRVCTEHAYLNDCAEVTAIDKQEISGLILKQADATSFENSLLILCRALQAHWKKPVILLIDEYDVPLACAQQNGYYHEMVSFIRNMLGAALKTNEALQFAILTGCLRIAKESIFTGLNNFKCYGISEVKFADKFGFTSSEVDDILVQASFSFKKEEMKEWYDGYCFGNDREMYCPWDILQYVNDLCDDPQAKPQAYWNNTSGNAIVRSFIGRTDLNIGEKFEALING
ncbi:MAG: AAA family ATPase, partial [Mailhella sp.]|nr:AAA family ATPase [Mailhella sp.]